MTSDIHQQFAEYFALPALTPYAYMLHKRMDEGHICLPLHEKENWIEELPEWYKKNIANSEGLAKIPIVGSAEDSVHPFILHDGRLYLQRYFKYESSFLERIDKFLADEASLLQERMDALEKERDFISSLFPPDANTNLAKEEKTDWQLIAAITAALNNFTIITGGPGTGKTTTVARLLAILYRLKPDLKVALAAPTGKAAARMAESLRKSSGGEDAFSHFLQSLTPSTIHRLLRPKKNSHYFHHDAGNPLPYDLVIIDESSMIDVALFAKLMDAIGSSTRLILLGDKDQLASVEAGSFFGDLCSSQPCLNLFHKNRQSYINSFIAAKDNAIPDSHIDNSNAHPLFQHIIELKRSRRFTGNHGIGKLSKAIISNDVPSIQSFLDGNEDEQVVIDEGYDESLFKQFTDGYTAYVQQPNIREALNAFGNLRVLCAVREGEYGLYATNKAIEQYLHSRKLIHSYAEFYENRPIILTTNNHHHGLFNGDVGIIRKDDRGVLMAWFEDSEGNLKAVLPGYLTGMETAYAMTIHKSQGSEFDTVLIRLPNNEEVSILTRELLYTAVTRARSKVLMQASANVILAASRRHVARSSGIAARLAIS